MRIYTRGGDKGKTGIHGGERVDKDDIRIEANGTLDELNAEIGIVRTLLPPDHEWQVLLGRIQREMMAVMSHVRSVIRIRIRFPMIWPSFVCPISMIYPPRWRITGILSFREAHLFRRTSNWPVRSPAGPNAACGH